MNSFLNELNQKKFHSFCQCFQCHSANHPLSEGFYLKTESYGKPYGSTEPTEGLEIDLRHRAGQKVVLDGLIWLQWPPSHFLASPWDFIA